MASPSIYDRQGSNILLQHCFQMPETLNPHSSISNMSGQKPKLSRLQLMKQNYERKRQKEVEEKLAGLRAEQEMSGPRKVQSGGTVRAFFAERRAMEASVKGDAYSLPPIESHFRKMKDSNSTPPRQNKPSKEVGPLNDYSSHNIGSGKKRPVVYHRKKSKGIDRQNPLPSLQKKQVNTHKPPTPNKRYETHHTLTSEDAIPSEIQHENNINMHHVPHPPKNPNPVHAQRRRVVESRNDEDESCSNFSDELPPNLTKLKALRQKKLSKQMSLVKQKSTEKPTDFQKWQMDQDRERSERLEKHRKTKMGQEKNQENSQDVSLSTRERELLEKIKAEQEKLKEIKRLQQELEEQDRSDEDTNSYDLMLYNKTETMDPIKDSLDEEMNTKKVKQFQEPVPQKQDNIIIAREKVTQEETPETNTETEQRENLTFLYEQAADGEVQTNINLTPCSICGRKFATDRLPKHEKICNKNSNKKRKAFDVQKQRVAGLDHEKYVVSGKYKQEPPKAKKADWRVQHENFIKTIRYAKGATDEPPPATENPHYVACPYCERKFNPETAERHIPRCKDIKARPAPPKSNKRR